MDYIGPHGHTIEAYEHTLMSGEKILTIRAELNEEGVYATPQALFAVAKKHFNNPKRYAVMYKENCIASAYHEK